MQNFNTPPSPFIVDNAPIHQVASTKPLGVYVDENLSLNVHIDTAKKIACGIGILQRSRPFVTFEVLSTIYSTLVQRYFDSVAFFLGGGRCNKSLATKLHAARILTFSPYDASVDNLFTSLAWKKLEAQRKIQLRLWFISL